MQNDFNQYVTENLDSSVQLTPELSTQIWKEKVVGGIHKAEALDGVQIATMLAQITKLTAALAKSERRRLAEQESMSGQQKLSVSAFKNIAGKATDNVKSDGHRGFVRQFSGIFKNKISRKAMNALLFRNKINEN
ncbi:hypothetical protein H5410_040414 [Solanum commersonii]|uniref:Uncharacterized protein n=1 Tax=Solanum commersonii TaxID=4109 RepID=A0A9J5XRB8_SOLCO|nr:hypothetical protein H5410_040414 [Solanum commersonii]